MVLLLGMLLLRRCGVPAGATQRERASRLALLLLLLLLGLLGLLRLLGLVGLLQHNKGGRRRRR